MTDNHVLEVALFRVKAGREADMPALRAGLRDALRGFPGLLDIQSYEPAGEERVFADLAKWDSLDSALSAADAFENGDPRFLPYFEAIEAVTFMGHFSPEPR
ncbi:antibiotic biosynthesis monooxygenase family protein [Arhodomonas sp. AD133]|uniref:antibiotic biosynthesis monooxygenase family protein n=1 Tax=Arhodomonas sp. AD133 TaxID=3415009 RepID=UPI003EBD7F8B